jgi:hypothetical protein
MDQASQLPALSEPMLTPVVQRALGHPVDAIGDWESRPLSGGGEAATSIYLVSGDAIVQGAMAAWKVVLKIVRFTEDRQDPGHWNYWKREPLAYQAGLPGNLPHGIAAPQVYEIMEQADESIWLWLEAITETVDKEWTLETYGFAAQQLGRFNGAYLTGQPLPSGAWVSHDWLRTYVDEYAPVVERLPELQKHPLVARAIPTQFVDPLLQLCADRHRLLAALDELPQTFCHLDGWHWNLFFTANPAGEPRIVAIDWAFAGIGGIGQEVAPLIFSGRREPDIETHVLRNYLEGLHMTGWRGDDQLVHFGYAATMALEYGLALIGFYVEALLDEQKHSFLEEVFGEPLEQIVLHYERWLEYPLPRAQQARQWLG